MPKQTEIAWAAGFFDGEGCTYANHVKNPRSFPNLGVRIKIGQTGGDEAAAILERFRAAVGGVGKVTGPRRWAKRPHWSDVYSYDVQGDGAIEVLALLEPYLSTAKRQQAARVITSAAMMRAVRTCNPSFLRKSGIVRSPETNRKISEGVRQAWRSPEKRDRITEGVRRSWEVRRHT